MKNKMLDTQCFCKVKKLFFNNLILVSFLLISILGGSFADNFFTFGNIFNILKQGTPIVICAMAMLVVILTGGIDLSVGAFVALLSVIISQLTLRFGLVHGIIGGVIVSIFLGLMNGIFITYGKMAPFIGTLVSMSIARGLALILSHGGSIYLDDNEFLNFISNGEILNIPILVYFSIFILVIFHLLCNKSFLGRFWIAIGSNRGAAYYAGISIKKYELLAYVISGLATSLVAIVYISRTGTGSPVLAQGFELDVIAAVVIGGASLSGGKGTVFNTLIGALILTVISNMMNLLGIPGYHQQIIKGVLIAIAVLSENLRKV